eukprot:Nk52_evm35s1810 gene=Nk52_evmTU35s1810
MNMKFILLLAVLLCAFAQTKASLSCVQKPLGINHGEGACEDESDCHGHGKCVEGACVCNEGYTGTLCGLDVGSICSGGGVYNGKKCVCKKNRTGNNCEVRIFSYCRAEGSRVGGYVDVNSCSCLCFSPSIFGSKCQYSVKGYCNYNGIYDGSGCSCYSGWTGERCGIQA